MVLGMKSKRKKGPSIKVDYIVHVDEIRPWPPSESLKSVQTVFLQWENGNENSGSFISVAGDSNIVFNESFMLPLTLYRKKATEKFRKNYLEFSLIEPRKDKAKGQVLATALVNLAAYGLIDDILSFNVPLNFKKVSDNSDVQPALAFSLEVVEKDSSNSSPSVGLSMEASLDNDDDDSEIASYTDGDDVSSHSSRRSSLFEVAIASPSRNDKNGYGSASSNNAPKATWNKVKDYVSLSKFSERSMSYVKKRDPPALIISAPISVSKPDNNALFNDIVSSSLWQDEINHAHSVWVNGEEKKEQKGTSLDELIVDETRKNLIGKLPEDANKTMLRSDTLTPSRKGSPVMPPSSSNKARLKHVKSVHIHGSVKGDGDFHSGGKPPDLDIPNGSQNKGKPMERKETKGDLSIDSQKEWKSRVDMLEEELREAAVIEAALYSIVPEHSSSVDKVHAPARRLSRFYNNACKAGPQAKRASTGKAALSGLVLVSKTCGNDVARLTFWLSNSIMLRAIVSQTAAELPHSNGPVIKSNGGLNSSHFDRQKSKPIKESDDWEDIMTLIIALEKVESWLFSRIVESVWWQAFMPHMQPTVAKGSYRDTASSSGTKNSSGKRNNLGNYEQGKFSIELWKKAFRDACERLCPVRAGGHECGCLSAVVILVMEQLVNRLDVAMFNAILRESAEETDPVSDPICDPKVLPVPAGKSSFTAGAQLKNIIGNWSRWLTDLFGLEDGSITEDSDNIGNGRGPKSFKAFRLLHALSDLMMLPFGMLADASTRKEVCPVFGPAIIKRVLKNFVPDEFNPNRIPRSIIIALNSEEISDSSEDLLTSFPCTASPTKYSPPSAALLTCVGEVGHQVLKSSKLSTLKKSYTSDDDLDELDSPLTSIIPDSYQSSSALARLSLMPKEKGGGNAVRYQLLREIWRDEE